MKRLALDRWLVLLAVVIALAAEAAGQARGGAAYRYKVAWATYVGGGGWEQVREVIPYADGSVLIGGQTNSADLRVTPGAVQRTYGGETEGTGHPGVYGGDCFLMHLSADGSRAIACTYFGGPKQERNVYGMGLDANGNVVITSACRSPDMPTTEGAFQRRYGGAPSDWMVAKLSPDFRRLLWCTYVGGAGDDFPRGGLAIDANDNVFIVGGTNSQDFPTTPGAYQRRCGKRSAAVVKLSPDGSRMLWGTLLGGSTWAGSMGVRVDGAGGVHFVGHTRDGDLAVTAGAPQAKLGGKSDCFLAGLSADGGRLIYCTYLGGGENEFAEHRPLLMADGSVLVTGVSASADFPTTARAYQRKLKGRTDGFLTKLAPDGRRFTFSTLLGGSGGDFFLMPTLDAAGNIFIVGQTSSKDFPTTAGAIQPTFGGGKGDGVLAVLSADGGKLLYATYLGGAGDDMIRSIAITDTGEVFLVGNTGSKDFPATRGSHQTKLRGTGDGYVVKLVRSR